MRTLVLGLGNPYLTDDGVGVRVAEAVRAALPPGSACDVGEASVGGLTLMEMLVGYDRAILIDALYRHEGRPGTVRRLSLADLSEISPTQHSVSAHDTNLATALALGRRLGLPLPREIVTFAVEVENITDFAEEPTPSVARAVPEVVAAVMAELGTEEPAAAAAVRRAS